MPAAAWPFRGPCGDKHPRISESALAVGGSVNAARPVAGSGSEHATGVVAATEPVWPARCAALVRLSAVGAVFILPAGAAGVGIRSVCELRPVRLRTGLFHDQLSRQFCGASG